MAKKPKKKKTASPPIPDSEVIKPAYSKEGRASYFKRAGSRLKDTAGKRVSGRAGSVFWEKVVPKIAGRAGAARLAAAVPLSAVPGLGWALNAALFAPMIWDIFDGEGGDPEMDARNMELNKHRMREASIDDTREMGDITSAQLLNDYLRSPGGFISEEDFAPSHADRVLQESGDRGLQQELAMEAPRLGQMARTVGNPTFEEIADRILMGG